jgi:hypothetical protein
MDGAAELRPELQLLMDQQEAQRELQAFQRRCAEGGGEVPAHVVAEAGHTACLYALTSPARMREAGYGDVTTGKLFRVSADAASVECAFTAAGMEQPAAALTTCDKTGVIVGIEAARGAVKLQFAGIGGASGWYPIIALQSREQIERQAAALLEREVRAAPLAAATVPRC